MLGAEVVAGIIGSLPCHYPPTLVITGTPELLHPAWQWVYWYGMVWVGILAVGMLVARVREKLYYPH